MLLNIGFIAYFFLPIIESYNREVGFSFLIIGSTLILLSFIKKKIYFDIFDFLWILLLAVFSISILSSISVSRSFTEYVRYICYFIAILGVKNHPDPKWLIKKIIIPMIIVNSIILSIIALLYFIPNNQFPIPSNQLNLYYPNFGHNRLAIILIFAIPLTVVLSTTISKSIHIFLYKSILVLLLSAFFLTMGRGAMVFLSLAILIYLIFFAKNRNNSINRSSVLLMKIGMIVSIFTVFFLIITFIFSNFIVVNTKYSSVWKGLYKPVLAEHRLDFLYQAWNGFKKSPIDGTGLDTFWYISKLFQTKPHDWSWYLHNHYLELFLETGILGGALFIFIFLKTWKIIVLNIKNNFRQENDNLVDIVIFISLLASSLHALIDYNWHFLSIFLIYWIFIAYLISKERLDKYQLPRWQITTFFLIIILIFLFKQKFISNNTTKFVNTFIDNGQYEKAIFFLKRMNRLDQHNSELTRKLGFAYEDNNDYDNAHLWYQKTISLDPIASEGIIKRDYQLYLALADFELDNLNLEKVQQILKRANSFYPFFELNLSDHERISMIDMKQVDTLITVNKLKIYIKKLAYSSDEKMIQPQEIFRTLKIFNETL